MKNCNLRKRILRYTSTINVTSGDQNCQDIKSPVTIKSRSTTSTCDTIGLCMQIVVYCLCELMKFVRSAPVVQPDTKRANDIFIHLILTSRTNGVKERRGIEKKGI